MPAGEHARERSADGFYMGLIESRRQVAKFGNVAIVLDEAAHLAEIASELFLLRAWQTEVHVELGARVKDRRVCVAESDGLVEPLFEHLESRQKKRSNAVLERKVLELA